MNKYLLSLAFAVSLIVASCSNPELEEANKNLEIAKANRNHPAIMVYADKLLDLEPENITATAALRDSARIYDYLIKAVEMLAKADANFDRKIPHEIGFDMGNYSLDDPAVIKFIQKLYNDDVEVFHSISIGVLGKDKASKLFHKFDQINGDAESLNEHNRIRNMGSYFGLEGKTETITDEFLRVAVDHVYDTRFTPFAIEMLKEQANYLVEAKSYLKKAERLDNRFMGIMELEETIDKKAAILTSAFNYQVMSILRNDLVDAGEYFDKYSKNIRDNLEEYTSGPLGTVDFALMMAGLSMMSERGAARKVNTFSMNVVSLNKIQSIYKDLEDEFEIDSIEPGIKTCKSMARVFKLSHKFEGSVLSWEREMSKAISDINQNFSEFLQELIPIDKIAQFKSDIDETTNEVINDQIKEIYQKRSSII